MNDSLNSQIKQTLSERETEDLLEMWRANDRVEWTDEAFTVLAELLRDRLGELPPQNEPLYEHAPDAPDPNELHNDETVFYQPSDVFRLIKWLKIAAIAYAISSLVTSLPTLPAMGNMIITNLGLSGSASGFIWLILIVIFALGLALAYGVYYLMVNVLASMLKILMQMEFNSRGAGPTPPEKQIDA